MPSLTREPNDPGGERSWAEGLYCREYFNSGECRRPAEFVVGTAVPRHGAAGGHLACSWCAHGWAEKNRYKILNADDALAARAADPPFAKLNAKLDEARALGRRTKSHTLDTPAGPSTIASATEEPHSWTPINLILTANEPPEPATLGGIAYPGRRHVYSGEPETLKSWAALILSVGEIRQGRNVLYVDFNEMGGHDVLERLRALGLADETITERFIYLEPHEAMTDPSVLADVVALVRDRAPSLVVLDAFTGALETHRLDPASGVEVQRFYRTVVDPLRSRGGALIILDHLKKDPANRGKFSIGSERKIGACDVHLGFESVKPFGRGRSGRAKIVVHKDRPGYLARPKCAELALVSDPETGLVTWTLTPSEQAADDDGPFRPTHLMEKASRYVEKVGEVDSRNALQRGVGGNAPALRQAIEILVAEKYLAEKEGPRNSKPLSSLKPYREADES